MNKKSKRIASFIGALSFIAQIWVLISIFADGLQIPWGTAFIPTYILLLCGWVMSTAEKQSPDE